MALDQEMLDILRCPKSDGKLQLIELPDALCKSLTDKYSEHFRDETPSVVQGLYSPAGAVVYPIVSDIPIMLIDEALPASAAGIEATDAAVSAASVEAEDCSDAG